MRDERRDENGDENGEGGRGRGVEGGMRPWKDEVFWRSRLDIHLKICKNAFEWILELL